MTRKQKLILPIVGLILVIATAIGFLVFLTTQDAIPLQVSQVPSQTSSTQDILGGSESSSAINVSEKTSSVPASKIVSNVASSKPPIITSSKPPVSSKPPASSKPPVSSELPVSSLTSEPSVSENQGIEDAILVKVNELRQSMGVAPLTSNSLLAQSSSLRSNEMYQTEFFEHTRPDGSEFSTAFDQVNYSWAIAGENIGYAKGYPMDQMADIMFEGWKNSPSHYEAMIDPRYVEIGISIIGDSSKTYGTQHFGHPR